MSHNLQGYGSDGDILVIRLTLFFIALFLVKMFFPNFVLTEATYAITAMIIAWYTYETYQIRKIENERMIRESQPIVSINAYVPSDEKYNTVVLISNKSKHSIAALLKCTIKFGINSFVHQSSDYSGRKFWNVPSTQERAGHFDAAKLVLEHIDISNNKLIEYDDDPDNILNRENPDHIHETLRQKMVDKYLRLSDFPKLTMEIDMYCENHLGGTFRTFTIYHYDYFYYRWIPEITYNKAYWHYSEKPEWVNKEF